MSEFLVTIDQFEGPLDLMLHLIKDKKLDLFNLDVSILTDQYIAYIHQNEDLHLEIAGEYLAELAGLLEIKSKSLLPKRPTETVEEDEDPKEKLIRRLIEYQKFKDIAQVFDELQKQRNMEFAKPVSLPTSEQNPDNDPSLLDGNPYDLMKAMNRVLRHMSLMTPKAATIRTKEYLITDIYDELKVRFGTRKDKMTLTEMIEGSEDIVKAVSVFIAVLDLIHSGTMIYTLENEEVYLKWSGEEDGNN